MPPLILTPGQRRLDQPRGLDEVDRVVVVLLEAGRDRQHVRIEDDVRRIEAGLLDQQPVRALADRDLPLDRVGLALFVERHHDDRRAVAAHELRLVQEVRLAFLERDRIDDRLALHALQARLDDRPLRAVDHHRHARDFRLGRDEVEERRHRLLGLEQPFVHVDVDDVGAAADLLERDRRGLGEVVVLDQPREPARSGHVRPLADHLEVGVGADDERLEAGQAEEVRTSN